MVDDPRRFAFRFTGANKAMALLGLTPHSCYVELTDDEMIVRFGWAFGCRAAIATITSVTDDHQLVTGWGAHGWRGVWLVNGTSRGLLRIDFSSRAHGRALVFALRIRALRVGIEDPDRFRAALAN